MKRYIKPGEFFIGEDTKPQSHKVQIKPKLEFGENLISFYTAFRNQVYSPKSVLYPSCGFDASPSRVFENVVFVSHKGSRSPNFSDDKFYKLNNPNFISN